MQPFLTRFQDITDGTAQTIMVTECAGRPELWRAGRSVADNFAQGGAWVAGGLILFAGATPDQAFFVRTSAALEPAGDSRDVAIALRVGLAPRAPSEFLTYDFRYHAASLTTEVRPVRDAERHLG